jgi:hypothetical protein
MATQVSRSSGLRLQGSVQPGREAGPDLARQRPQRLALGSHDRQARLTAMRNGESASSTESTSAYALTGAAASRLTPFPWSCKADVREPALPARTNRNMPSNFWDAPTTRAP